MSFQAFVQAGWQDHATDAAAVGARLPEGVALVQSPADLAALSRLAAHVMGEHLGRWGEGARFMKDLTASKHFAANDATGKELYRHLAILRHGGGDLAGAREFFALSRSGGDVPEASDRIRYLAGVAAALTGQKRTAEAVAAFHEALDLAAYGPGKADPAARQLAVTGNNLAADLEERASRSPDENALMILAATTARKYWEIAGGWMEVERAEYRLALCYVAAGDPSKALHHAQLCHAACVANNADAFEMVFANQALARAARAAALAAAEKVDPQWREYALRSAKD